MMNHKKFKKSLEQTYKLAKKGISKEDKQLLLNELDEMAKMLEDWKAKNEATTPKEEQNISS